MRLTLILKNYTSLKDAAIALDKGGVGFLAIINDKAKLLGILTDGDIRRALISEKKLLKEVINNAPNVMYLNSSKEQIRAKLKQIHRRHMPIIDQDGILHSVFSLDDIDFVSKENFVVIMAGGLGKRLGTLTKSTPKPMLFVGDRPMLQHLIEQFREQGFINFIICVNYKKEIIQDYFEDGKKFGVNIQYVVENKRMGTAGALSLINKELLEEIFFVINSDVLTHLDYQKLLDKHLLSKSEASMCVRRYEQQIEYGVVKIDKDDNIIDIEEKPLVAFNVNAGIYALSPSVLNLIPEDCFYDMPSLFEKLLVNKSTCTVVQLDEHWIDIGKVEDLAKANSLMNAGYTYCK